jgi:hypothetical protein
MREDLAEEARAVRRALSQRFDFDVGRICAELMKRQRISGQSYVPPPETRARGPMAKPNATAERDLAPGDASRRR